MPGQRRNTLRTRERQLSPKVAADPGRTHKFRQEKMQDRQRQQQQDADRPDRGGPQGRKDKDFQRKF